MIEIFHKELLVALPDVKFQEYLALLPNEMVERIKRFKRWQDAHTSLKGKVMLLDGLIKLGFEPKILEEIQYNSYGKPELPNHDIYFSISHSETAVVCVISSMPVGIDIEKIKPIKLDDFKRFLTSSEWENINTTSDSLSEFYILWTKKEAVMKAIGQGLNIPLTEIRIEGNLAFYQNETWSLKELNLLAGYQICLASD